MEQQPLPSPASALDFDTAPRLRVAIARLSRRLRPTKAALAAGLAESEGINPTMLSRVIAELVEAGLLERDSDAGDRRAVWVNTTLSGKRLAERIRRERTDAVSLALGALSDDDQDLIERALPAVERLAERLKGVRP